ncbi:Hypothetical predicted protein [Paramuricea clavata]|uniref:Uncharacterized protein n=1 Tax=Paramuricea clavata TaxID=317549 RepID=A0A7D9DKN8_PARCT|nr:Hypothetical predicted protein [Paramuricea clavata]
MPSHQKFSRSELIRLHSKTLQVSRNVVSLLKAFNIFKHQRGKRGGRRKKAEQELSRIPVRITWQSANKINHTERRSRALTSIPRKVNSNVRGRYDFPNILCSNSRSIMSKIDELDKIMKVYSIDITAITESWLSESISDDYVTLVDYNIYRCDRVGRLGGGICAWVKSDIQQQQISQHQCDDYESMWLKVRPRKLPRGFSSILVGIVYRPNNTKDANLLEQRIIEVTDNYLIRYPDAGAIIMGDFNRMNVKSIERKLHLKQVVNFPTRNDVTLDLILTNISEFYTAPQQLPPADSVVNKMSVFYNKGITALDKFMPSKPCRLNTNDKPWMTSYIKNLIVKRQRAWKKGNVPLRNFFRNKVSKEIKLAMGNHYRYNLDNTRSCNPRKWWKGVKAITRQKPNKIPDKLRFGGHEATGVELTELISSVFLRIVDEYQPLEPVPTPPDLIVPDNFLLSTCQVSQKLFNLNAKKSCGPEPIPTIVLKKLSTILAPPLTNIFNSCLMEVPKKTKVVDIENDLRPISLTSPVAKVYESHLNSLLLDHVGPKLDDRHFGSVKGSSTTCALVDLMNFLYSNTDNTNDAIRLCFYDLSKGFDRVDHNILLDILRELDVHPVLIQSIRSFLTGRHQRVCVNGFSSE